MAKAKLDAAAKPRTSLITAKVAGGSKALSSLGGTIVSGVAAGVGAYGGAEIGAAIADNIGFEEGSFSHIGISIAGSIAGAVAAEAAVTKLSSGITGLLTTTSTSAALSGARLAPTLAAFGPIGLAIGAAIVAGYGAYKLGEAIANKTKEKRQEITDAAKGVVIDDTNSTGNSAINDVSLDNYLSGARTNAGEIRRNTQLASAGINTGVVGNTAEIQAKANLAPLLFDKVDKIELGQVDAETQELTNAISLLGDEFKTIANNTDDQETRMKFLELHKQMLYLSKVLEYKASYISDIDISGVGQFGTIQYDGKKLPNYGGARANGGSIFSGRNYLVGERGPEIIQAHSNGYVVPNNKINSIVDNNQARGDMNIDVTQSLVANLQMSGEEFVSLIKDHSRSIAAVVQQELGGVA